MQDHLQTVDSALWARCMLNESIKPPKFYPEDFKVSAGIILHHTFGLTQDTVSHDNCRNVYLRLVKLIDSLTSRGVPVCSMLANASTDTSETDTSDTEE